MKTMENFVMGSYIFVAVGVLHEAVAFVQPPLVTSTAGSFRVHGWPSANTNINTNTSPSVDRVWSPALSSVAGVRMGARCIMDARCLSSRKTSMMSAHGSNAVSRTSSLSVRERTRGWVCGKRQQEQSVGVLKAQMTEEEMAIDQALIARVAKEVEDESGVDLEQLINPSKVINLERDLVKLRQALESGSGNDRSAIEQEISKKESTLAVEKRSYMQGWLKKIFVSQAVITTVLGGLMAYDAVPFFPDVDLSVRVLGFWFVWLFTVPSLRARKPGEAEKVALNIAFLATPVVSFASPFITKDPGTIYWANIAVLTACYMYGFTIGKPDGENSNSEKNQPKWLKFIYKALDFGSGQERGARSKADEE